MDKSRNKLNCGDKVFAKVRGHPYWPAIISHVDSSSKLIKYTVNFYGTSETSVVKEVNTCLFAENKSIYGIFKKKILHLMQR